MRNLQSDIIALADMEGRVMIEYNYDPWGKISYIYFDENGNPSNEIADESLQMITAIFCPLTYRGYNYDFTTGLYYLQSRYYNPEWGRFLNCDDTSILLATQGETHGANLYAYCENNPINHVDYTGYLFESIKIMGELKYNAFLLACGVVICTYYDCIEIVTDRQYTNTKKGGIQIPLDRVRVFDGKVLSFSDILLHLYISFGDNVFDFVAKTATEKFAEQFSQKYRNDYGENIKSRDFLFSDSCVSNEIKHHCLTKWHLENKIFYGSVRLEAGCAGLTTLKRIGNNWEEHTWKLWNWDMKGIGDEWKSSAKRSCESIEIYEQDANAPRDSVAFGYYYGIREKYFYTKADPYYYPELKERYTYVRPDWITNKI